MTRVSEGSSAASLKYSMNRAKAKLEDLQLKGATLKSMTRPSDNPVSNVEVMQLKSMTKDNQQFLRNADFALMQLNVTEKSLEQMTELMVKAKELAIAQSSDLYNPEVRENVSNEVRQMRHMLLGLANKRLGSRYIFGGFKTTEPPFTSEGRYLGDKGHMTLEVSKDFFVQTNLHGSEVFYVDEGFDDKNDHPLKDFQELKQKSAKDAQQEQIREIASEESQIEGSDRIRKRENLFSLLDTLATSLENNEPDVIQNLLEKFDTATSRLITLRTRVGSMVSSIENSKNVLESDNIDNAERTSKLVDADIADLFSELTKQQEVLKTTYKSTQGLISQNLLDFMR